MRFFPTAHFFLVLMSFWGAKSVAKQEICSEPVCEYSFSIRELQSMVYIERLGEIHEEWHRLFMRENGTTYYYEVDFLEPYDIPWERVEVPERDWFEHYMLPMDGVHRRLMAVNGQIPGPTIEVMQGSEIVVNFTNEVHGVTTSMHWHGMHQRGSQWMDGAPGATQCPLSESQTYQYRFIADPPGTHWYHSHEALQTGDGVAGFLIVHEQDPLHKDHYDYDEHRIAIQDWYHTDPEDIFLTVDSGFWTDNGNGLEELWVHPRPYDERTAGGSIISGNPYVSAVINGRGRFNTNVEVPLSSFDVTQNMRYRMRFLNPGMSFPFMVSIDSHKMTLLSFCGYDISPFEVESFVMFPAERFDIMLHADQQIDNYWIRARTLESNFTFQNQVKAVLHYVTAPNQHWNPPTSRQASCSEEEPCVVANCPFPYHPYERDSLQCISVSSMTIAPEPVDENGHFIRKPATSENSKLPLDVRLRPPPQVVDHTHFFNWRDPRQVNKIMFKKPPGNALFDGIDTAFECPPEEFCSFAGCHCTHMVEVPYGSAVEMVFINQREEEIQNANALHPIHMHGHSFYVVAEGHGDWDEDQQKFGISGVVACENLPCTAANWRSEPTRNLVNPPRTDTVLIYPGHFVVVRFYADNPGIWHLHCHVELHGQVGMGLLIKVDHSGDPDDLMNWETQAPDDLPKCGSYVPSSDDDLASDVEGNSSYSTALLIGVVVAAFVCGISVPLICIYCRRRKDIKKSTVSVNQPLIRQPTGSYGSVSLSDSEEHQ